MMERDGFAALGPVLDAAALAHARAIMEAALPAAVISAYGAIVHDPHRGGGLYDLLRAIGERACDAAGARELVLLHDVLIVKPPGGGELPWHQDYSYWPLDRADGITVWIALDDADARNGCLAFAPGTHVLGERAARWGLVGAGDPRAQLPPLDEARCAAAIEVAVAAGSAIAHHSLTWHRSGGNATERARRGWSTSWVSPATRWAPDHAPYPTRHPAGVALPADHLRVQARAAARAPRTPSSTDR